MRMTFRDLFHISTVVAVYLFMYIPVLVLMLFAFNDSPFVAFPIKRLTLSWFAEIFANTKILAALWHSLVVAFFVTAISVTLGTMGAFCVIRYNFRMRYMLILLLLLPIIIPRTILAISFTTVIEFFELKRSLVTVVLAQSVYCLPFAAIVVSSVLWRFDGDLEDAARDLYAGRVRTFMKVTLPLTRNGIMAGALICLILSFSEYTLTWFTSGHTQTLPIVIFAEYKYHLTPRINALSTLIVLANVLIAIAGEGIRSRTQNRLSAKTT